MLRKSLAVLTTENRHLSGVAIVECVLQVGRREFWLYHNLFRDALRARHYSIDTVLCECIPVSLALSRYV
jgi:hypothetical protein